MHQSNETNFIRLLYDTIRRWINSSEILNDLQEKTDGINLELDAINSGLWEPYVHTPSASELTRLTEQALSNKIIVLEAQRKEKLREFSNLHLSLDQKLQDLLHFSNLLGQASRNTELGVSGSPLCFLIELGVDLLSCLDKQIHFNENSKPKDWLKFLDTELVARIQESYNKLEVATNG